MALENCAIRILDPLSFEPVAPGNEGLLFAKGPMVMQGYLGDDELTNKVKSSFLAAFHIFLYCV